MMNAAEASFGERSLPPAALHYPIGYGGRASSVVVSGTPVVRPHGQYPIEGEVVFAPSKALDYELEMACVIGKPSKLGQPVPIQDADDHIFGVVLLNDWSGEYLAKEHGSPGAPMRKETNKQPQHEIFRRLR